MKIVQINTFDYQGGAAKAAYRLREGLKRIGTDCWMVVKHKVSKEDSVIRVTLKNQNETFPKDFFLSAVIQGQYIDANRTNLSNTLFSLGYPGYDLTQLNLLKQADIINLHWLGYYQSPITLYKLFSLGKPVVWTLHDQWAFTGGCHYSAGCEKYRQDCSACPQLNDDPFGLPAAALKDKLEFFKEARLVLVTPSRWLAACARESALFKDFRVEVIPNSLETDVFRPVLKSEAKKRLSIPEETVTLLFGAESSTEKRKGFKELVAAIEYCKANRKFQQLMSKDNIKVIYFGHPNDEVETIGLPVVSLGYLDSDEQLRDAYAAADIFVLPSLEDNLPNTMLEALSCGTPVIAFDVGGIPDVIVHGVTGHLVPAYDTHKFGEALLALIFNSERRKVMGQNGRKRMIDAYSLETQAGHYLSLFKELHGMTTLQMVPQRSAAEPTQVENQYPASTERAVHLDTTIGSHFQEIYDKVLFKSLKEFAPLIQKKWQASEPDRVARLEVINTLSERLQASEADRAARLAVIHDQGRRLGELEAERNNLSAELQDLRQQFEFVEADRAARLEVIERQGKEFGERMRELEADRTARLEVINELQRKYEESEADRSARLEVIHKLEALLKESEIDKESKIKELTKLLQESETDRAARLETINELSHLLEESEVDRAARLETINELNRLLEGMEAGRAAHLAEINHLSKHLQESEADRAARLDQINSLSNLLKESEANRAAQLEQINELSQLLQDSEADRQERLEMINRLSLQLKESELDRSERIKDIQRLNKHLEENEISLKETLHQFKMAQSLVQDIRNSQLYRSLRKFGVLKRMEEKASNILLPK